MERFLKDPRSVSYSHKRHHFEITQVPGYRPRMLAVRSIPGITSAKIFRLHLFWLFTLCGMSLPYRIWFKRHCDSLRVTIVKETSVLPTTSSSYWVNPGRFLPGRTSLPPPSVGRYSAFRDYMQGRALYGSTEGQEVSSRSSEPQTVSTSQGDFATNDLTPLTPEAEERSTPGTSE